jgi:hypothetical protein
MITNQIIKILLYMHQCSRPLFQLKNNRIGSLKCLNFYQNYVQMRFNCFNLHQLFIYLIEIMRVLIEMIAHLCKLDSLKSLAKFQ